MWTQLLWRLHKSARQNMGFMTIITAIQCATNKMLANTWQEMKYCFDVCQATNGAHAEI